MSRLSFKVSFVPVHKPNFLSLLSGFSLQEYNEQMFSKLMNENVIPIFNLAVFVLISS